MKIVAQNKKAFHEYDVLERLEAGIVLTGDEVKALRAGHLSLVGSYATIHGNEIFFTKRSYCPLFACLHQERGSCP